jgi:hypothetical protein
MVRFANLISQLVAVFNKDLFHHLVNGIASDSALGIILWPCSSANWLRPRAFERFVVAWPPPWENRGTWE